MYKLFLVSKDSLKAQVSQMSFRKPTVSNNNNGLLNNNNGLFAKASPGCTPL